MEFLHFFTTNSSGVGRSSVFVAMDMALQQIEANGTVDVFNVVRQMRNRNPNVIKSEVSLSCNS